MTEEREAYYVARFTELLEREEAIAAEWKRTHYVPSRGHIVTPERQEIWEEQKQLSFEYMREKRAEKSSD